MANGQRTQCDVLSCAAARVGKHAHWSLLLCTESANVQWAVGASSHLLLTTKAHAVWIQTALDANVPLEAPFRCWCCFFFCFFVCGPRLTASIATFVGLDAEVRQQTEQAKPKRTKTKTTKSIDEDQIRCIRGVEKCRMGTCRSSAPPSLVTATCTRQPSFTVEPLFQQNCAYAHSTPKPATLLVLHVWAEATSSTHTQRLCGKGTHSSLYWVGVTHACFSACNENSDTHRDKKTPQTTQLARSRIIPSGRSRQPQMSSKTAGRALLTTGRRTHSSALNSRFIASVGGPSALRAGRWLPSMSKRLSQGSAAPSVLHPS